MAQRTLSPEVADAPILMTYEEFLAWADEDTHAEWVDGEVIVFMPPTKVHQRLVVFLSTLLELYTQLRDLGEVLVAPFEMRLEVARSARQPDVLFVSREHLDRASQARVDGPADLVIEIISDDSVTRDRRDKLLEYQRAGVPEYWIVDARERRRKFEPFSLSDRGVFELIAPDGEGRVHSRVLPGFWIDPAWLWQDPLPKPLRTLAKIAPDAITQFATDLGGADDA